MRAARVRPVVRPERLRRGALLQQQLVVAVEHEDRERAMQHAVADVTFGLRLAADFPIELVDEDQRLPVVRYDFVTSHPFELPDSRPRPDNPPISSRRPPARYRAATRRSR